MTMGTKLRAGFIRQVASGNAERIVSFLLRPIEQPIDLISSVERRENAHGSAQYIRPMRIESSSTPSILQLAIVLAKQMFDTRSCIPIRRPVPHRADFR